MIAVVLLAAVAVAADSGNRCTLCHPDVRVQFEKSLHRAEQVTCVACHGGDPKAVTVEAAHRGSYRGRIRRRDVPALCAACHADPAKMRPYNLPADQYALYQTSAHGRTLEAGDESAAVCTDCHGVHEILAPENPASSVHPRNVPKTCAACHADTGRMKPHRLPDTTYQDYAAGVHGKALLEDGNLAAPSCSRCHGAHGATPPGVGDVDKVCGQCHEATRVHFLEGPHKVGLDAAGLPECASCHDHHRTQPGSVETQDEVCSGCHAKDSEPVQVGARMSALYAAASEEVDRAARLVEKAAAIPLAVEDHRARLAEARTSLLESLPVMHAVEVARVEHLTGRARSLGSEVESEINGALEDLKWRRVGLMLFWFYLILTVAILVRMRRAGGPESAR